MKQQSDTKYYIIIIMLITLGAGTFLHDPILHGLMAYMNGWSVESYSSNLFTGQTTSLAPSNATTNSIWLFYMFPSMAIIILTFIVTYIALMSSTMDDRFILIIGTILIGLNITSLYPAVEGSDSDNALKILIDRGTPEPIAVLFQYTIFIIFFILWCYYIYIAIENNSGDAKKRMKGVLKW